MHAHISVLQLVEQEAWNVSGFCLSRLFQGFTCLTKCPNCDNLSIKVRIMAADTWHVWFNSPLCWGTSSYSLTVRGTLKCVLIVPRCCLSVFWGLLASVPQPRFIPWMLLTLYVFYHSWLFVVSHILKSCRIWCSGCIVSPVHPVCSLHRGWFDPVHH